MRLRDLVISYVATVLFVLMVSEMITSCSKEVRYVRHGEPCNNGQYDCVDLGTIK
jgi:hypothetical protein